MKTTFTPLLIAAFLGMGTVVSDTGAADRTGGNAGLIGPGQYKDQARGAPPMSPGAWQKLAGNVLDSQRGWGRRFKPRGMFPVAPGEFETPGGIGVLYNSVPPAGFQAPPGFAASQTGSLAFSQNLLDWHDYPDNPVMYKLADWQGSQRAMPRAMLYDEKNSQWVVYFVDLVGHYPGIRAIGAAYSTDLINWRPSEQPMLTVHDYVRAVPDWIEATDEEIDREGRVYSSWAIYHEGRYYLQVQGTNRTGSNRTYGTIILVADEPEGPWRRAADFRGDFTPQQRPVYAEGRWYTVFTGRWDDQLGFGLAWSENLLGPYERNPENPIISTDMTTRARPQLFQYRGVWAILFARGPHPGPMRLALADFDPDSPPISGDGP